MNQRFFGDCNLLNAAFIPLIFFLSPERHGVYKFSQLTYIAQLPELTKSLSLHYSYVTFKIYFFPTRCQCQRHVRIKKSPPLV